MLVLMLLLVLLMSNGHHHDAGLAETAPTGVPNLPMVLAPFTLGDSPGVAMALLIYQLQSTGPTEDETDPLLQGDIPDRLHPWPVTPTRSGAVPP